MVVIERAVLQKGLASSRQALMRPTPDPLRGVIIGDNLRLVQEGYLSVWDDIPLVSSNGTDVEFVVSGADLYNVVSAINAESLELRVNKKSLGVKYGKSNLRLPFVVSFGDVPDIPSLLTSVSLPPEFMVALVETPKFLARTEDRPSLSCVYVKHEENEITICATNGFIMFFASFEVEERATTEYLIPIQTIDAVSKVFGRKAVTLGITDKGHIFMSSGTTAVVTPGFNGAYPTQALDFMRSEFSSIFTANKKELVSLLRLGMNASESERVDISQISSGLDLDVALAFHEIRLESDFYLESVTNINPFKLFHLNPRFLLTCLAPMGDQVTFSETDKAIRISDGSTVSLLHKLFVS